MKSKLGIFSFVLADDSWRKNNIREGELKLSQKIKFGIEAENCTYAVLGISEDIGPQMNSGQPGSHQGFQAFCSAFQNCQSNRFLQGDGIGIVGEITQNQSFVSIEYCKNWVDDLDEFVFEILQKYCRYNQSIITIGGGHNNAYPLLRFAKKRENNFVSGINIDPHADCRETDFRHSGNPFSYAIENKFLDKYNVFGLHESYNNEYILDFLSKNEVNHNYFENYLDDENNFWNTLEEYAESCDRSLTYTLDIDLDAIAFQPSSAFTPSGFTIEEIRKIIRILSRNIPITSLHFPEGSPSNPEEEKIYGKMLSYFVVDFIKNQNELNK